MSNRNLTGFLASLTAVGRAMQPSPTYTPNGSEIALGVLDIDGRSHVVFACESGLRAQRWDETVPVSFLGHS